VTATPFNQCGDITDVAVIKDTAHIEIWYPRSRPVKFVEVGLMDVRAADNIRISYDFDRDGWKIEQASIFQWELGDEMFDADWQEVAFVQAWAREQTT
jgi:hypothetical protein